MATRHASSGELLHLQVLGAPLDETQSFTLLRDAQLEVMRLVVPVSVAAAAVLGGR